MTSSRPRHSYLAALVDGGGTVPPEVGVLRRLVERGHEVIALAEDSMATEVEAAGAVFRPWSTATNRPSLKAEHDPLRDWECSNPFTLFSRLLERQFAGPAPAYASDLTEALADHDPDLVLCSFFAYGAMTAAEAAEVPFDVLFPNIYPLPVRGRPPFGLGARPARGPLGRGRDRLVTALVSRQWDKALPQLNELRATHGLEPVSTFFDQVHKARRHLVLTSPDFDFPGDDPSHVRHVGAVLDDPGWAAETTWKPPPGDDPLVLVSLSSTFQDQAECLRRITDALGTLPVRGVVTTGPALDPADIDAPGNVTVVASAPHSQVLAHAAAAITHGGHGTVVRALAAGVPLLVMPHGRDQPDNAARVVARGAGLSLKRSAKGSRVASAVERLIAEPSFGEQAEVLGAALRRGADSEALVHELETLDTDSRIEELTET